MPTDRTKPRTVVARTTDDVEFDRVRELATSTAGFLHIYAKHDQYIEVWADRHGSERYELHDQALIEFLFALKDNQTSKLYAAKDVCEYIEKSARQQPSVFVRDAIVQKAAELKAQIEGGSRD